MPVNVKRRVLLLLEDGRDVTEGGGLCDGDLTEYVLMRNSIQLNHVLHPCNP